MNQNTNSARELAEEFEKLMEGMGFTDEQLEDHIDAHQFILDYIRARTTKGLFVSMQKELNMMRTFKLMRDYQSSNKPEPEAA